MKTISLETIITHARNHNTTISESDIDLLSRAYETAKSAHAGQLRQSGEPYFNHVCAAAYNCAEFGMDATVIAAGLLHDTIEDTDITAEYIESEFGTEIRTIVEGVTKLGKLKYQGNERHGESLRKFFISVAADVRVVIVKLADRLHNLETLSFVRPEKQRRIALESIEIYAQMASRLGMGKLSGQIQDTAFPYAEPEAYKATKKTLDEAVKHTSGTLNRVYRGLIKEIASKKIPLIKIEKRVKGIYSFYKKLLRKGSDPDTVHDVVALRIIVPTDADCYRMLGVVHAHYRPVPGRIKDYIAMPKPNGYQSLHTTVFAGDGNVAEIQIRTPDMHQFAEYGIASHHMYKGAQSKDYQSESFGWIQELSNLDASGKTYPEFLKTLRTDFFQDRIFVCTPKGDIVDLPKGSTIIDFAYAIHSDIGNHASGAFVGGKYTALKTELQNNDIVEIVVDKKITPSSKWLSQSISSLAHKHINNYLSKNKKGFLDGLLFR
jgi:GTP pyrophosphokinase